MSDGTNTVQREDQMQERCRGERPCGQGGRDGVAWPWVQGTRSPQQLGEAGRVPDPSEAWSSEFWPPGP